jgi:hypothetical protein
MRVGVVRNPLSGANRSRAAALGRVVDAHPRVALREATDPPSVAQALRELADAGVDTVAVSGGDGTVHAVLDTVFGASPFPRRPRLAVLRGGTANMTARDVGLRGRQDRALAALLDRAANGGEGLRVTGRPVMRIDPGAGRAPLHGMYFGAAAIAQGIDYCKRHVHALGLKGEIGPGVTMARFVLAMALGQRDIVAPVPIGIAIDGRPSVRFDCEILHVTTLEALVLGLRPYWGREEAPLHYASVRAAPRHWVRALPGVLRGRAGRHVTAANGFESHNAHRLDIALASPFFVDGELFAPSADAPLTITSGGNAEFVTLQ